MLTTDESELYGLSREDLATHGRAVEQFSASAARDLADFTVKVLGLPSGSHRHLIQQAAAKAGLVARAKEILAACDRALDLERAYSETIRRRGLA